MSTFGSTEEEKLPDPTMVEAKKVAIRTATLQGVSAELQVQAQKLNTLNDKIEGTFNLLRTMQEQFALFQRQRAIELNGLVNHGPTVRED